jgi:S-adenosylmethionine hydrolase
MTMSPVITLTTDFGLSDGYVASVKGVILNINPKAVIVDISHSVESQNIVQAAFILSTVYSYFPNGTIHIVIVDPGVGSQRKAIILKTQAAYFLAPDNGVLSYIIDELSPLPASPSIPVSLRAELRKVTEGFEAVAITNAAFWRQPVSATFHGRDIFAPVAAHLSMGISIIQFGEPIDSLHVLPVSQPYHDSAGNLTGQILHIDSFGNLITNIRNSDLSLPEIIVDIKKRRIHGIHRFYAETEGLSAIMGSSGYLEIALSDGSAAMFLKAKAGDEVKLVGRHENIQDNFT